MEPYKVSETVLEWQMAKNTKVRSRVLKNSVHFLVANAYNYAFRF